ncbi:hypothetical protein [Paludisphaera mucosa]|uniref:Uncharacterized protein n=1 Tax=Paludisphaera mucosa TaxID=3030827 RepID=A0ABT6FIK8_9BACT|nr:hypothetical protein [Paludisphaera mucosa]MDG3007407.1 hypothetical protein [Paludisphaera mucosa]
MQADRDRNEATGLDRLWEATRPPAPPAEAWDRVWASLSRLDDEPAAHARPLTLVMPPPRAGRWAAAGLVLIAQAAAILLAVGITLRNGSRPDADDVSRTATAVVRIEEGQLVLIRSNADVLQTTDLSPQAGPAGVDAWYLVYNLLESMAGPVVAMSE